MKSWGVYLYLTSVIIIIVCVHFYYNIIFPSKLCMNSALSLFLLLTLCHERDMVTFPWVVPGY